MKLYSYVIRHDTGFSPNPFGGYCTLACCKPTIRRRAEVGDWVIGLSPKAYGNRLVFAMQVEEIVSYDRYFRDPRFSAKIPDYPKGKIVQKCGDNIYKRLPHGGFRQLQSMHRKGTCENPQPKAHDLGGKNVLVSKKFYYFGSRAVALPKNLNELRIGRGHKSRFSSDTISAFTKFISRHTAGVKAPPSKWPHNDNSWKTKRT
jgi:hypothetical protein